MAHGGVETALIKWFRTFDPGKVDARLLCFANPNGTEAPFVEAAARAGLEVQRVPWSRSKPVFRAARATREWLERWDVDLLHCHNTYANLVGLAAARNTRVQTLTTVYVWSGYGVKRRMLQWIDRRLLPQFDQVTAHCEAARQDTVARGIPADRIRLLTCGFDEPVAQLTPEQRRIGRERMGVGPGDTVLIKVARFWPEKRHDVLLRAFRQLLDREPGVRLWIPGVGPMEAQVKALAASLGVLDRCDFLGFRTDLPELLALSDIQVHASDEEGVALAILAGMAAARPIVSTKVGGLAEVIRDGHSGVLVPAGRPELLASAVFDLIHDRPRQEALGRTARRFVEADYSLAAATSRVEGLYAEMVVR
jgi:glycosyltransferase involved in cell wall biosynthesis